MNRGYEDWCVVGALQPVDINAASGTVGPIDMSLWEELLVYCQLGVAASGAQGTFTLADSPTSGGSYTSTPGKVITSTAGVGGVTLVMNLPNPGLNAGARFVEVKYSALSHSLIAGILVLGRAVNPPAAGNQIAAASNAAMT